MRSYNYDSLGNPLTVSKVFKGKPGHANMAVLVVSYHYNADVSLAALQKAVNYYGVQRDNIVLGFIEC